MQVLQHVMEISSRLITRRKIIHLQSHRSLGNVRQRDVGLS